jgi:hypothetical protein
MLIALIDCFETAIDKTGRAHDEETHPLRKLITKIFNIGGKRRCGRDYGSRANIHQEKSIREYVKVSITAKRCEGCCTLL